MLQRRPKNPRTKFERMSQSELNNYCNTAQNLQTHMFYIFAIVLYDKMGFSFKKLMNCTRKVAAVRNLWQDDNDTYITTPYLREYCQKKHIPALQFVNKCTLVDKLALADMKKGCKDAPEAVNIALYADAMLISIVLRENYRFSLNDFEQFFNECVKVIHLYNTKLPKEKGYVFSDNYIRQIFIEDEGFDILLNKKIEKGA